MVTFFSRYEISGKFLPVLAVFLLLSLYRTGTTDNHPAPVEQASKSATPLLFAGNKRPNMQQDTSVIKKSPWYKNAISDIAAKEYEINWHSNTNSYQAPNRAQGMRAQFFADRLSLEPRTGTTKWNLQLQVKNITSEHSILYTPSAFPWTDTSKEELVFNHNNQFRVEYSNSPEGVRENFIVEQMPQPGTRELHVQLALNQGWKINQPGSTELHFLHELKDKSVCNIRYNDLKVWDANGKKLAARFVVHDNTRFDISVDAADAVYPVTIDPLSSTPDWMQEGNQQEAYYGCSVASAGDVNGDGYSDVLVGALFFDWGQGEEGRTFLYYGSAAGLSTTANWMAESNQPSGAFGCSVSTAGDVNGDGFSDVIIGAYGINNPDPAEGRAYVYYGSSTGLPANPNWTAEGNQPFARFGASVATAGDVNGDGFSDVLIGAYTYDEGATDDGKVFLYYGSATGLAATPAWTATNNLANTWFGYAVNTAGDINGDGFSDVIIGAPHVSNGALTQEGQVYAYYGSGTGLSPTADWTAVSNIDAASMGASVAAAGDVNGDGYGDILVGAFGYHNTLSGEGAVYAYYGSATGLPATYNWIIEGHQNLGVLGSSVACAGDINGDGFSDIVAGAPMYDEGQADEGKIYVFNGSPTGLPATATWTAQSNQAGAEFGSSVACAGDVNGDGYSDIIAGARYYDNGESDEGAAFLYLGKAAGLLEAPTTWSTAGNQTSAALGGVVAPLGDLNGDGYYDVAISAPLFDNGGADAGKVFVYYGTAAGMPASADWSASGPNPGALFGMAVAGAGDVNGDGLSDLLIGAPQFTNGQPNEGAVFIYHGAAAGLPATANRILESNQSFAAFGTAVGTTGDVNDDGFTDIMIGSPLYDNDQLDEGRVFVYYGSATGIAALPSWTAESNQSGSSFGSSLSSAGDVDGNGYSDIIVGAPNFNNGQANQGKVYLFYGNITGLPAAPSWTATGQNANDLFGQSVSSAGDVNGDGHSDVIIGSPGYNLNGGAFVYYGASAGLPATASWSVQSSQANSNFGISVSSAGDVNGDGYSDIIIGAPDYDTVATDAGVAFVYQGSPTGISPAPAWTGIGMGTVNAKYGYCVTGAGDINGDGFSDIMVGSPGATATYTNEGIACAYYGNITVSNLRNNLRLYNQDLSSPLGFANINEHLFGMGLYARSPLGRAKGKLVWEVEREGFAFSGASITNSTQYHAMQSNFTDLGLTGTELKALSGRAGIETKVRARVAYDRATAFTGQLYGPWRYVAGYQQGIHLVGFIVLPVHLVRFTGELVNTDHAHLQWTVAGDEYARQYELQRSTDGTQFTTVTVITSSQSSTTASYEFTDPQPVHGKTFYRLKITGTDNKVSYSPILQLQTGSMENWSINPNPVSRNQDAYISITSRTAKTVSVVMTDLQGKTVFRKEISLSKGYQVINIGAINVAKGMYSIHIGGQGETTQGKKIIVE